MQEGVRGEGAAVPDAHGAPGLAEDAGFGGDEAALAQLHRFLVQEPGLDLRLPGLGPALMARLQGEVEPGHPGKAKLVLVTEGFGVAGHDPKVTLPGGSETLLRALKLRA